MHLYGVVQQETPLMLSSFSINTTEKQLVSNRESDEHVPTSYKEPAKEQFPTALISFFSETQAVMTLQNKTSKMLILQLAV